MADPMAGLDARTEAEMARLDEAFAADLEAVLRALRLRINRLVRTLTRDADDALVRDAVNLEVARGSESALIQAMQDAGYEDVVDRALHGLPDLAQHVGIPGASFSGLDLHALEAFRQMQWAELLDIETSAARDFRALLMDGVIGTQDVGAVEQQIADLLDTSIANARTLYETAQSDFLQTVIALQAPTGGEERWLYSGPIDGKLRPFCLAHVGRVYTRAEIDAMDSGQGVGTVFVVRGGFNCRHLLRHVSHLDEMNTLSGGEFGNTRYKTEVAHATAWKAAHPGRTKTKQVAA